jgi:hypothetical protein
MTATPINTPKFRAFTQSGAPLAGGKVYTYAAGTTTPKTSWTDYTATVANANPVILDANGEANIWLDGNYKVKLEDSAGALQWTVDNISSLTSQTAYAGGTVTGTADALIVASVTPTNFTLVTNASVIIIPVVDNTGAAATINVASSGVTSIKVATPAGFIDPPAGILKIGVPAMLTYNGTYWIVTASLLTTPPFIDSTAIIKGSADTTKLLRIEVDGFTTATTRVLTAPNYDGTIVTLAGIEALTNKILDDATTAFYDTADPTKKLAFQCSGITTATTRTVTIPDSSGTMAYVYTPVANSLGANVALNNIGTFFDGPSVAQGSTGTFEAFGTVTLLDTSAPAFFEVKLWDGTTVIASTSAFTSNINIPISVSLSGFLATPAGNIRMSVKDVTNTTGVMVYNQTGTGKDCTLTVKRIS